MEYRGSDKHKIALFEGKQDKLTAGDNITLTPQQDGTVRLDASGGGTGTVTDVLVDGQSVVNEYGQAEITMPSDFVGATSQQAGLAGLVPAPAVDDKDKVLKGDGTWGEVGGNVDDIVMNGQSIVDDNKIANFKNYVELTQAEYEALPASKLTDGILYCIKDSGIVEGDQFAPVIYSLDEREIGRWVDGKPLYVKTIDCGALPAGSAQSATTKDVAHNISNLGFVVSISGSAKRANGFNRIPLPFVSIETNTEDAQVRVMISDTYVRLSSSYNRSEFTESYVTLFYTKTTDVAGSGSWGIDGVPMVHYDDTERIVGTWFGETLYERTIYYDNADGILDTSQHDYEIASIPNIILRSASGSLFNSVSGNSYSLPYVAGAKTIGIVYKSSDSLYIRNAGDTWSNAWKFNVIIRYTKMS